MLKETKRTLALVLALIMMFGTFSGSLGTAAYADEPETEEIILPAEEAEAAELPEKEPVKYPAFKQSAFIDWEFESEAAKRAELGDAFVNEGLHLTLSAPEGVFPEGSKLDVKLRDYADINLAVSNAREPGYNVRQKYCFEVNVYGADGETYISPNTSNNTVPVTVTIAADELPDAAGYSKVSLYRTSYLDRSRTEVLYSKDEVQGGNAVTAEAYGLGYWTLEFEYLLTYRLTAGEEVLLKDICDYHHLSGTPSQVISKAPGLFTVTQNGDGEYVVKALSAFGGAELELWYDGVKYSVMLDAVPGVAPVEEEEAEEAEETEETAEETYTIKYTAAEGGKVAIVPDEGAEEVLEENIEQSVTDIAGLKAVKAVADEGYVFTGWKLDDEMIGEEAVFSSEDLPELKDSELIAVFEEEEPGIKYTINFTASEGGKVAYVPEDGEEAVLEESIDQAIAEIADLKDIEAVADEGYLFKGWMYKGEKFHEGETFTWANVPMLEDSQFVAAFEEKTVEFEEKTESGVTVKVVAPAIALPEDAVMKVSDIEEEEVIDAVSDAVEGKVVKIQAVDISFWVGDEEVEPAKPVQVKITASLIREAEDPQIVHIPDEIDEENEITVIETETPAEGSEEMSFEADKFSVYAVIIIEEEEDTLTFEDDNYLVTITYTKEANIPVGTELTLREITPEEDRFWELLKAAQEKINEGVDWEDREMSADPRKGITDAAFFDISLVYDGKEIEPAVPLGVKIEFKKNGVLVPQEEITEIVHFTPKGPELISDAEVEYKDTENGKVAVSYEYEQNGFSEIGSISTGEYNEIDSINYSAGITVTPGLHAVRSAAAPVLRAAGDTSMAASKNISDQDKDGIYDLTLSITGSSESSSTTSVDKANVVIVVDVSGSMDSYTYSPHSGAGQQGIEYFGVYNGTYFSVSWRNNRWQYNGGGGRWYDYSGTVYTRETRLEATQTALKQLTSALLSNNEDRVQDGVSLNDIVEITLVKFAFAQETNSYNGTSTLIRNVNTDAEETQLNGIIDNLWAGGGTNWERALAVAKQEADAYKTAQPDEAVSVIFLTDGVPTSYGTTNINGQETRDNTHAAWNEADDDARSIVSAGYTLYNIFAFGTDTQKYNNDDERTDADYLRSLTNYAYTGSGTYANTTLTAATRPYFFNASDTSALQEAFEAIISSISGQVGYGGVDVHDGVTTGVTSTSVTVDGGINTSKLNYTIKSGSNILATVHIDGNNATFTIGGSDYPATGETVTTVIGDTTHTNTVFSVEVDGKTYKMSPATFDSNGKVQWDLAGLGIIENGYTYELSFEVWPNQLSYDLVADLNNGIYSSRAEALATITDETLRNQVDQALVGPDSAGKYSIRTNYEQYVDYYTVDTTTDETTGETTTVYTPQDRIELGPKDPVALTSSEMDLRKLWDDSLDQAQLDEILYDKNGNPTEYKVKLHVWKEDTLADLESQVSQYGEPDTSGSYAQADAHDYIAKTLGWNGTDYDWVESLDVAPGTMINVSTASAMGIDITQHTKVTYNGKTYVVLESGHYYTVTEENIERHFELNTIVYHPMLVDGVLSNVTFKADGTVEKIVPMSSVDANNTLKGGINVLKRAFDQDTEIVATDDIFTVQVTVNNADGTKYLDWDYRIYYGQNNPDGTPQYDAEGNITGYGRTDHFFGTDDAMAASGSSGVVDPVNGGKNVITLDLYIGDTVRIINVPAGVTYSVVETKINGEALDNAGAAGSYVFNTIKYETREGSGDYTEDTGNTHTVKGNSACQATVYNKVPTQKIALKKIDAADNTALSGVSFELYKDAELKNQLTEDALGNPFGGTDGALTTEDDGTVAIGTLLKGTYYLVEKVAPTGYVRIEDPITVTVEDNKVTVSSPYTVSGTGTEEDPFVITITNIKPVTAVIPVRKNVTSATEGTAPSSWTYTFTLSAADGTPLPSPASVEISGSGNESKSANFGTITYTAPGTYTYTVTESGTVDGVTNDSAASTGKTVTVTVTKNSNGTLTATASSTDESPVSFTNTYRATGTVVFPVKKSVTSTTAGTAPSSWTYTFTLSAADGTPLPSPASVEISGSGNESKSANFGTITYTAPGTYTYTVTESGTVDGITNDSATHTVVVEVVDNGNGTLTATADSTADAPEQFDNTYNVGSTTVVFPVKKNVTSTTAGTAPSSWTYTFTLSAADGTPLPSPASVEISGSGNESKSANFGTITYTAPGTYTYTVTESGTVDGITNDSATHTVVVEVVDNHDGTLTATADSTASEPEQFDNTYNVEPVTAKFPVKKILEVPEGLEGPASWSYTIDVTANNGAPVAKTMKGTVDQDNDTVTFGDFTYTKPGTYTYTVTESGTVAGVTNDTATHTVVVEVTDNGNGTLTATADSTTDKPLTFTNKYSVKPVIIDPPVAKILSAEAGLTPPDITGKFTFAISGSDGAPMPKNETTITNSPEYAHKTVKDAYEFGDIEFTQPGTYTYTVTESGSVPGVTNDSAAADGKTWTFKVTDKGDGTLSVTPTTDQAYWTFTNTYVPDPVKVPIPVIKTITKTDAPRGEVTFTFTLTGNGPLPEKNTLDIKMEGSKKGTADGEFGEITFTKPGTYTYTISETKLPAGWSADGAKSGTVTITVTDNGSGKLEAEITSKTVEIKNQYEHRDPVPKTDDNTNLDKWGIGAAISLAGFAGVEVIDAIVKKRKKEDEAK